MDIIIIYIRGRITDRYRYATFERVKMRGTETGCTEREREREREREIYREREREMEREREREKERERDVEKGGHVYG